ncbi:UNVERIFIED_CONTAM: hypothetical protein Sradi_5087300 [Sesamum radiatum]|uniref:GYF domain-containing protein n=1 Tax=Sesamum radiatum TaxID=300843 RepID=A0AAW2M3T5_SESRA
MFFWYYLFFLIGELFTVFSLPAVSLLLITLQVGDNVEEAVDFDVEEFERRVERCTHIFLTSNANHLKEIGADDDVGIQAILSRLEKQRSSDFSINSGHNRSEASEHYSCGYLSQSTLVWSEGYSNWQPLSLVPGLLTDAPPQNAPVVFRFLSHLTKKTSLKSGKGRLGRQTQKQRRAEAELNINDDQDRPATPPEGEKEFTDDDGTTYKWDWTLGAWVPQ